MFTFMVILKWFFVQVSFGDVTEECSCLNKGHCDALKMENADRSQAVVLYDETKISPFYIDSKHYTFVDKDIIIKQDWKHLGVAAVVWDAAVVLCEFLEKRPHLVQQKTVIELGAGSGIVGIVAALLGGKVTITDRDVALPYLQKVVTENLDKHLPTNTAEIKALDWTQDRDKYTKNYDVILAADVIYIEDVFDDLLKTFLHLSHEETVIILSCRIRYDRDDRFLDMMRQHFRLVKIFFDTSRQVKIFRGTRLKQ